jgi:hypothetical protein
MRSTSRLVTSYCNKGKLNCHLFNTSIDPKLNLFRTFIPLFTLIATSKNATSALYSTRFGVRANLALTHFT